MPEKHDICENCGHYYFLHDIFSGECIVCDDPSIPLIKKCSGFKER